MIKSFLFALSGVRQVWREEGSFRVLVLLATLAIVIAWYLEFTFFEWMVLVGCITMVLSAEMVNTAVEDLCNKVEPNSDPLIAKIKDMMAGFVLVASFGAFVVGIFLLLEYFSFL